MPTSEFTNNKIAKSVKELYRAPNLTISQRGFGPKLLCPCTGKCGKLL